MFFSAFIITYSYLFKASICTYLHLIDFGFNVDVDLKSLISTLVYEMVQRLLLHRCVVKVGRAGA